MAALTVDDVGGVVGVADGEVGTAGEPPAPLVADVLDLPHGEGEREPLNQPSQVGRAIHEPKGPTLQIWLKSTLQMADSNK